MQYRDEFSENNKTIFNPIRSGGGALKAPPPSDFLLSRI